MAVLVGVEARESGLGRKLCLGVLRLRLRLSPTVIVSTIALVAKSIGVDASTRVHDIKVVHGVVERDTTSAIGSIDPKI